MRNNFEETGPIPIMDLLLDQTNYRLGPLESQSDCISMMLHKERGPKLEAIARDIAARGLSPDPIIVLKNGDEQWVVKDGNRRITALKLLNNPAEAPEHYRQKFQKIREDHQHLGNILTEVKCITSDEKHIFDYMVLTHAGEQEGIGQVRWDARAKDNVREAAGEPAENKLAREILNFAKSKGITESDDAPITNIQRLFQDTSVQERLCIKWNGTEWVFSTTESELIPILREIVQDFVSGGYKVDDIYYKESRSEYIDKLFVRPGITPPTPKASGASLSPASTGGSTSSDTSSTGSTDGASSTSSSKPSSTPARPTWNRPRLIPPRSSLSIPRSETKAWNIAHELSREIDVRKTPNAAGVLLRLLIEFGTNYYINKHTIPCNSGDQLYKKIGLVSQHLKNNNIITDKQHDILNKTRNSEEILSAHTLNQWIHNPSYAPNPQILCTFWDNISFYVTFCWSK